MPLESHLFSLPEEITDSEIFKSALTHRSAGKQNNERLEFLGDAVLGLVIAQLLFDKFPDCSEGDLSRLRAHLVCKSKLAELAKQAELGKYIQLGSGERKSGGHHRASILADSLEAIIGAIYLIKGFAFTENFIADLYAADIKQLPDVQALKDAKTRLQEKLQSQQINVPEYRVIAEQGEGNNKQFTIECIIKVLSLKTTGQEKSKKKAEQVAAQNMLELYNND